jgi:hypothetical protein
MVVVNSIIIPLQLVHTSQLREVSGFILPSFDLLAGVFYRSVPLPPSYDVRVIPY